MSQAAPSTPSDPRTVRPRAGARRALPKSALRLLAALADDTRAGVARAAPDDLAALIAADLAQATPHGARLTAAGAAHLRRARAAQAGAPDPFRAQHLQLGESCVRSETGSARVTIDEGESPLVWLARRKGRDRQPLIAPHQLLAGERLRADFTRAQLMPRITSNWELPARDYRSAGAPAADVAIAARQSVNRALAAVGPEFSGLLVDVCCFLKRLEDVERERAWPARSAKIVLQLALDRLARHYGLFAELRGKPRASVQTWLAPDAAFTSDVGMSE